MEKTMVFGEHDEALIVKIEAYQVQRGIAFQEAVKELCEMALNNNKMEWGSF